MKKYNLEDIHYLVTCGYLDARKNERNKASQVAYELNFEESNYILANELNKRTWEPQAPQTFVIMDPLPREIFAPLFRDRIVSHILYNLTSELFERTFIHNSYSCRKGKGTLCGIDSFERMIRSETNNYQKEAYVLNIDISGYFMSIDKKILLNIIFETLDKFRTRKNSKGKIWEEVIDFDFVKFLFEKTLKRDPLRNAKYVGNPNLLKNVPPQKQMANSPEGCGIIIGDLMSQMESNIYLNVFDQFVKRELKIKHYGRYVDDARLVHSDYNYLLECKEKCNEFLKEKLHLTIHPNKTTITKARGTNYFLGGVFEPYRRHSSDRTLKKFQKRIKELNRQALYAKVVHLGDMLQILNSYLGYFSHFNDYNFVKQTLDGSPLHWFFTFNKSLTRARMKTPFELENGF